MPAGAKLPGVDEARTDRLIAALEAIAAGLEHQAQTAEAWNLQQQAQWAADRAVMEEQRKQYQEGQRQLAAQLGIIQGGPRGAQ